MRVESSKERLWSRLIRPILWPVLLAQGVLVALCLIVGVLLWWMMPSHASWSTTFWLMLALLLGSSMNVLVFLTLLRQRLATCETALDEQLATGERHLTASRPDLLAPEALPEGASTERDPARRLSRLLDGMAALLDEQARAPHLERMLAASSRPALLATRGRVLVANAAMEELLEQGGLRGLAVSQLLPVDESQSDGERLVVRPQGARSPSSRWLQVRLEDDRGHALVLLDDLEHRERRLDQLLVGRQRAREESRLKSGYLSHLRREMKPLMASLGEVLDQDAASARRDGAGRSAVLELRERLTDISLLLANLAGEPPAQDARAPGRRAVRVLIVDDGPVNLMLAQQVLEGQGLAVETATSGAQALEWLARASFDLVLMDIFMPEIDGVETSLRWREQEAARADGRRSVLVALTANASDADRRRFREAGMDDYLAKPYRPQALIDMVRRWLPDTREEREPS
ncbi:response regulator [Halomonas sp. EGI 63088]|uniref:Response regulator n=1 Tax=Halomonas flagellata TaxID=2920385 RepID=A0ABS9RUD1_9GAMM|nr:response regulator [Halomonas flagellata]MCH4563412.1 response regulator [Halomonas flagellata]